MKLGVYERLILLNILPKEGNFATLKINRKLRESMSFDEEELKLLDFQDKGEGRVEWKQDAVGEKDIPIGEKATDIIIDALKKLNDDKKLTDEHYSVYEKFVGD